MKLRIMPIIIGVVGSAIVLFGSWYAYRFYAVEQPLRTVIEQTPGVEQAELAIQKSDVSVQLVLQDDADLQSVYRHIADEGRSTIGQRALAIEVNNPTTDELEQLWSSLLFPIAQAMETRQYGQIPQLLQERAAQVPGMRASAKIDGQNVYISIADGTHRKDVILPRAPLPLGVWADE